MQDLDYIHLPGESHVAAWALPFSSLEVGAVSFQTYHKALRRLVQQIFSCGVGLFLCLWDLEVSSPSHALFISGLYPAPLAISRGLPVLYFCFLQCGLSPNSLPGSPEVALS